MKRKNTYNDVCFTSRPLKHSRRITEHWIKAGHSGSFRSLLQQEADQRISIGAKIALHL